MVGPRRSEAKPRRVSPRPPSELGVPREVLVIALARDACKSSFGWAQTGWPRGEEIKLSTKQIEENKNKGEEEKKRSLLYSIYLSLLRDLLKF